MKNRYLTIALCVLVLVLALVSACGGGKESTTTNTATATSTKTSTATATSTQTKTSTPTGNSLSDILGLGASITSVKYDMSMTAPGAGTITATVYDKNNKKFREEATTQGQTMVVIIDMDAGEYYMYTEGTNQATKMTWSSNMTLNSNVFPEAGDPSNILDYNPQITGTETLDGKSCTVFTFDIPGTGSMKEWIWTDKGFPLKMEETTTSQGTTTIEFTNIDFSTIPDSMFELPAGVIITTVGG